MPKRIDKLTAAQSARFDEWADRWIEVGLRTGEADWERFEAAARECYRFAGIPWPGVVVRVPSPLVGALAAPIASYLLRSGAVDGAVRGAVGGAVRGAVGGAVGDAVGDAVDVAVRVAVGGAVDGAVDGAVGDGWYQYLGGQFWVGGYGWGGAWTSFFREVCGLELKGDLWDRAHAYEATMESACWWWPNRRFVMVCDRPKVIEREQIRPRGWGSHRLHCTTGPAVAWDGWELFFVHGVRVPPKVIQAPETLTVEEVLTERNAEVRRVMIERVGADRLIAMCEGMLTHGRVVVHEDTDLLGQRRRLLRLPLRDDEPICMVEVANSTREPDGSFKSYMLRVPPTVQTCQQAVAWTFDVPADEYMPAQET